LEHRLEFVGGELPRVHVRLLEALTPSAFAICGALSPEYEVPATQVQVTSCRLLDSTRGFVLAAPFAAQEDLEAPGCGRHDDDR
ncbi:MAG: hypothetical protein NDJ92_16365, partial [Thermoanaerobaculia bacterium]|nr:hypothetical protein [Thermoanaerobaculia bacterium]